ncbi:MAG: hypothetical protein M1829_000938 [Trizodia sp. TS-e1964]|nr:MAG: hypothetical protein M1829_000938 [Trizodia sp. TS-e1964]
MSLIPAETHAELGQLLRGLSSPDNQLRSSAEERLNSVWVVERPDTLLMGLAEVIQGAEDASSRSFAAVLVRRIAIKQRKLSPKDDTVELYMSLNQPQKEAIRHKLLQCLLSETVPQVRNKIGDAVAELGRQHSDENELWPQLLEALFEASQSINASQREMSFRIFATTPGIIQSEHQTSILAAFSKGFKDEEVAVRLASMEAFASFFRTIPKKSQQQYWILVPELLNILPPIKESQDSEHLSKALVALIDIAEIAPKMFRPLFRSLVTFSITVIQDKELGDQARQNALELMATFADYAPAMCRKDESYTRDMVTQCLSLMTDIGVDDDDAAEWNASEDLDVEESDSNHVAGEQCMDRLATKLGGQALLHPTFNWLPRMMTSSAWRDRHAALMAISAISEGCRDLMVGELDKVLDLVIPSLRDPHPRVRWAGCNALGQMSTDFSGVMQQKYHHIVLTNIIPVLESTEPRVQSHAAAALVNFCEEAETSILEPYLDGLLSHLLVLLRGEKRFVQEQALSTIATIADSAEAAFGRYYDTLMPLLFGVLKEEQSKEFRLLRAKAMECATLIALAVGKEKLGQDAILLVQLLGSVQQNITDTDDPQAQYLMHCWGRMCRVLGADFLPYLPAVIPPLMDLASAKADIQLLDDEDQVAKVEQEEGWELVPLKGKVIGIRTTTLDDKYMAIDLIAIYAQILDAAFEPYVLQIMENSVLPGLAFFFHDPVRTSSAKCLPLLLSSYKRAHLGQPQNILLLWEKAIDKILEVLSAEPAVDTLADMYECFYESVLVMGKDCLTAHHMAAFIESAKSTLEDYLRRFKDRLDDRNETEDGEEDSEDTLTAIDQDSNLLSDMNKSFHTIFKNCGANFLPHWQRLLNFYNDFVTSQEATQRQWALCIYDDVLEFCGEQSWNYSGHIINPLISGMRDEIPANRQAACYGVGIVAQKGGLAWSEFVAASIPTLFQVTQHAQAREDDHVFATENACTAIAKILHYNSSKIPNAQDVIKHWVSTLPVVNDEEAAPYAYSFLAQLIDQQNPYVLSQPAKVFVYIVQALEAQTLQGQTAARIVLAANQLLRISHIDMPQIMASLSPESQHTIRKYFG